MRVNPLPVLLLLLLAASVSRAQESPQAKPDETQAPGAEKSAPSSSGQPPPADHNNREEHPRLFWIIPTYHVSNIKSPQPLSAREKFRIVENDMTDPFTYAGIALDAGIGQAQNDLAGYGQGAAGYGKRFGAGLGDTASSTFFEAFFFPALLHQDPRYFRKGFGPFKARLAHALVRPVVTRKDSGGNDFNWSGILGRLAACGLSNTYYPKTDTGADVVFSRAAIGTALSATSSMLNEFGPDVERWLLGRKRKPQP